MGGGGEYSCKENVNKHAARKFPTPHHLPPPITFLMVRPLADTSHRFQPFQPSYEPVKKVGRPNQPKIIMDDNGWPKMQLQ